MYKHSFCLYILSWINWYSSSTMIQHCTLILKKQNERESSVLCYDHVFIVNSECIMITSLWQLVHLEHVMYDKMYTCIYFRIFWRIITYNLNEGIVFLPTFHTTHLHVTCLRRLRNIWSFSC